MRAVGAPMQDATLVMSLVAVHSFRLNDWHSGPHKLFESYVIAGDGSLKPQILGQQCGATSAAFLRLRE